MMRASSLRLSPLLLMAAALVALAVLFAPGARARPGAEHREGGVRLRPESGFPLHNVSVDESVGTVRVPVTVSALPASSLAVSASTSNITAEGGSDYAFGTAKTVTFSSSDDGLTQFVEFPVPDDATYENKEFLRLDVGGRQFRVADALVSFGIADGGEWTNRGTWVLSWTGTGLVWAEDDSVSLSLVTPPIGGLWG